jgi:hypothetical protein
MVPLWGRDAPFGTIFVLSCMKASYAAGLLCYGDSVPQSFFALGLPYPGPSLP